MLKRLRAEGLALLYISHRMHEIAEIADECTVFRNGRNVATYHGRHQDRQRGRRDDDRPGIQPRLPAQAGAGAAATSRRSWRCAISPGPTACRDISLTARAGEVVGLGGLDGQGQRELLLALFGVLKGVTRRDADRRQGRCRIASPRAREVEAHRHGADPRGPQDRGADAADVGARQSLLRRARPPVALRDHRPRRRAQGDRRR